MTLIHPIKVLLFYKGLAYYKQRRFQSGSNTLCRIHSLWISSFTTPNEREAIYISLTCKKGGRDTILDKK